MEDLNKMVNTRKIQRKLRGIDLGKLVAEVTKATDQLRNPQLTHKVPVNGQKCPSLDAPYINSYANQKRRGEYRLVEYNGEVRLAKHRPNQGGYLLVA